METAGPSSSSPNEITDYICDLKHKLKLIEEEDDAILQECECCKDQIFKLGSCYKCTDCIGVKYFHKACLNAKRSADSPKAYPFIPDVTLKFSRGKKDDIITCTACRHAVRGIMYTGSLPNNEDCHLHPQCIELPPILPRDSIELNLCRRMQTNMNRDWSYGYISNENFEYACQTSMKCHFCQMSNDQGWCYGKISNKKFEYAFHVRCMRKGLAREWFKEQTDQDDKLPSRRKKCFDVDLYRDDLRKILKTVGCVLEVAKEVLNLIISAFVGAHPLATLLSLILHVTVEVAKKILKDAEKKLLIGNGRRD